MATKPTTLDAYPARSATIHAKLEQLKPLASNHLGTTPTSSI